MKCAKMRKDERAFIPAFYSKINARPWGRRPVLVVLAALASVANADRPNLSSELVERRALYDRPFVGESIALAPDGRHLAYSEISDDQLWLNIADLEQHTRKQIKLEEQTTPASQAVATDAEANTLTYPFLHAETRHLSRGQLRCLRWLSSDLLLVQGQNSSVIAVHADGGPPLVLWDRAEPGALPSSDQLKMAEAVALPARVLPGLPEDRNHVLIQTAANTTHATYANVYRVDLRTGEAEFAGSDQRFGAIHFWSARDGALFDRRGWLRIDYWRENERRQPTFYYQDPKAPELPDSTVIPSTLDAFLGQPQKREFELSPQNYFGERSFPLGFDYDPNILYILSNYSRDTFGLYSLDLTTKKRVALTPLGLPFDLSPLESHFPDDTLVFDDARRRLVGVRLTSTKASTYWIDPELSRLQATLDKELPGQTVEILQWDTTRAQFLLRLSRDDNPGHYVLYTKKNGQRELLLDRAPWLTPAVVQPSSPFIFSTPGDVHLTGYLTLPQKPRLTPPALVIYCEGGPWTRSLPGFHREAQNLAASGVVVLRLNYRGSRGFGRAFLEDLVAGSDATPVADILSAVNWLALKYKFQRKRVAIMGEGFGGYIATRAIQLHPETFRCAVAINSPPTLSAWGTIHSVQNDHSPLEPNFTPVDPPRESTPTVSGESTGENFARLASGENDHSLPVLPNAFLDFGSEVRHAVVQRIRQSDSKSPSFITSLDQSPRPVLVVENTREWNGMHFTLPGVSLESLDLPGEFKTGSPELRTQVYARIEQFLNLNLYDFKVDVGEPQKLEESVPPQKSAEPVLNPSSNHAR